ncbi:pyridoxine 5'-phosphate synthase [Hansschlegelia quercus]|uniref:Pyridoxine 5'-phosphate synthase n=1 Tax=Hansschlegelia quercus TaxID=2528245 RepID=A0A4Q9GNG9_9HYPH|nr:pyridoxine 5'-phosphate synthase [Hansschlegelia quercus]TBN54314.1 pyridoxine 5'-phosphate synthase [Hansschlegelia quercus]
MTENIRLGVNIDHVATVRNARGGMLPDPVRLAHLAAEAGAEGITAHLREDRRHIRDRDIERIRAEVAAPLNFEMAATPEMLAIALKVRPNACCLVPEKREERTTEGGLDVVGAKAQIAPVVKELAAAGIRVSLFVEPQEEALEQSALMGAHIVELHTGSWCEALIAGETGRADAEFAKLAAGATLAASLGLEVHAGHGLDFASAETIAALPEIAELNIGHFLIGEALAVGLPETIRTMKAAIARGRRRPAS